MSDKLYVVLLGFGSIIVSCYVLLIYSGKMPGYKKTHSKKAKIVGYMLFGIGLIFGVIVILIALFAF